MPLNITVKKHKINQFLVLKNSCPNCNEGDLTKMVYRKWFTFFKMPLVPLKILERYECENCHASFHSKKKVLLDKPLGNAITIEKKARLVYSKALIASMTHMALIDSEYAKEEELEILGTIIEFEDLKEELESVYQHVKVYKNHNDFVFRHLKEAKNLLSPELLIKLLTRAAKVLIADGKNDEKESQLLEKYLTACGLPTEMYANIMSLVVKKRLI